MKPNRYPENPHLPNTMLAAHWDLSHACGLLFRAHPLTGPMLQLAERIVQKRA